MLLIVSSFKELEPALCLSLLCLTPTTYQVPSLPPWRQSSAGRWWGLVSRVLQSAVRSEEGVSFEDSLQTFYLIHCSFLFCRFAFLTPCFMKNFNSIVMNFARLQCRATERVFLFIVFLAEQYRCPCAGARGSGC